MGERGDTWQGRTLRRREMRPELPRPLPKKEDSSAEGGGGGLTWGHGTQRIRAVDAGLVQGNGEQWGAGKLESGLKGGNVANGCLEKVGLGVVRSSGHICVLS